MLNLKTHKNFNYACVIVKRLQVTRSVKIGYPQIKTQVMIAMIAIV